MKVSLVIDKQQSQAQGAQVYVINLDGSANEAAATIREAIALKASIEKAGRNWAFEPWVNDLVKLGIPEPNNKKFDENYVLTPDAFAEMIVSPFYTIISDSRKLLSVPACLVVGAPWQGHAQKSRSEALKLFAKFDEDTKKGGTGLGALAHWYKPFPFFQAGEGKNRVSLAQAYALPYLAQFHTRPIVEADTLTIRRIFFSKHWLLQCSDKNQINGANYTPFRLRDGEFLIPFPHLTVKLFKQYGVQQKSPVFRFFIKSRFKYHMLRFLKEKCYKASPWK